MSSPRVAGIVLAAGASRRMGFCKALARISGLSFVERIHRTLREAGCDPLLTVIAEPHAAQIQRTLGNASAYATNPHPERGMSSSLSVALAQPLLVAAHAAVVALLDHPHVSSASVRMLIQCFSEQGSELVRPRYAGRHGHPYLLAKPAFAKVLGVPAGMDLRPLYRRLTHSSVDVSDSAILQDIDHQAQLAKLSSR